MLPADGPGAEGFSNLALLTLLISAPCLLSWLLKFSWLLTILTSLITFFPLLAGFWYFSSRFASRKNEKVKLPGRPIESYLNFLNTSHREKYKERNKIPIDTFQTLYFNGDVEFKGDCLEVLEYRHDWASFHFTLNIFKFFLFGFIPEMILHTRSQGKIPLASAQKSLNIPSCSLKALHNPSPNSSTQMKNKSATTTIAATTSILSSSVPA
jgi:hypothetical protein